MQSRPHKLGLRRSLADYGAPRGATPSWNVDVMCAFIRLVHPERILELGSYFGTTTIKFAEVAPYAEVIGIDQSKERIDFCKEHYDVPNLTFVEAFTEDFLPTTTDVYDVAFLDDDKGSVSRVLDKLDLLLPHISDGGLVFVDDPFPEEQHGVYDAVKQRGGCIIDLPWKNVVGGLAMIQKGVEFETFDLYGEGHSVPLPQDDTLDKYTPW